MKCPGVNVHCPGCKDMAGIGSSIVIIILAAILYAHMGEIARALQIMAEIILATVTVITVSITALIAVKLRNRHRIYAVHSPANRQEYKAIKDRLIREKLVAAGIIKTIPVSITHTMAEIPPKMKDTVTAEILESSHMILPKWGRERAR